VDQVWQVLNESSDFLVIRRAFPHRFYRKEMAAAEKDDVMPAFGSEYDPGDEGSSLHASTNYRLCD
jgi:hypothetical protein